MAENIAQMSKTRKTIVERSVQLATFASALRRADFVKAAKALRTPIPSKVSNRKAAAQNYLEWEYGVKPVMSDLHNSLQTLVSHPGDVTYLKGSANFSASRSSFSRSSNSSSTVISKEVVAVNGGITCRTGVRVVNPNLFLANQLGLIDFALPWKLVPFSFVVDWFVNVEQVISSVSDWYGLQLIGPHYTEKSSGNRKAFSGSYSVNPTTGLQNPPTETTWDQNSVKMDRIMGIPSPQLSVRPFKGFSLQRGAQAIALVLSVLGK